MAGIREGQHGHRTLRRHPARIGSEQDLFLRQARIGRVLRDPGLRLRVSVAGSLSARESALSTMIVVPSAGLAPCNCLMISIIDALSCPSALSGPVDRPGETLIPRNR